MSLSKSTSKKKMKNRFKPTGRLITLLAIFLGMIIVLESLTLLEFSPPTWSYDLWKIILVMVGIISIVDLLSLRKIASPTILRTLPDYLPLNQWTEVSLLFTNNDAKSVRFTVFDHFPDHVEFSGLPQSIEMDRDQYLIKYSIRPTQRGHFFWEICEISLESRWHLWGQRRYILLANEAKVFPDFTKLYGAHLSTIEQWIYHLGVRPQQRRGMGQDFQQLREFREGDTLRQIDWKATAKYRYPITKEYQEERDQQIIFVLDCGQRMRTVDDDLTHFDHALNAMLLLSYVALKQDDAVGLVTFSSAEDIEMKPKKGIKHLNSLLNSVYNLECTRKPSDYNKVINQLMTKVKRRSLVVVLTNLRYNETEETLNSFRILSRHHKVLIASLREKAVDEIRTDPIYDLDSALTYCGNIEHNLQRSRLHEHLLSLHLPIIETLPNSFAPQLINHYLALKRSGSF